MTTSNFSDAQMLIGLARHLACYARGPERASLEALEMAGWTIDLALRLRGSAENTPERVTAIGADVGLGRRDLRDVVEVLEGLGWVAVDRDQSGNPKVLIEAVPAQTTVIESAPAVLAACEATGHDHAAIVILRATTVQPLVESDALASAKGCEASDADCESALRHLCAVGLVRKVTTDSGIEVVFNPNVWGRDGVADSALKAADIGATKEIGALLEELAANPSLPEEHVKSTDKKWIDFAVSHGLVERSLIQTSVGVEKAFLFSPHASRGTFGGILDVSGQVRQLAGSMMYATTYADYKLYNPGLFLTRLIDNGVAGDSSSIGTDYPMLEKAGIVRVVEGSRRDRYTLELLRSDVAEGARELLRGASSSSAPDGDSVRSLRGQLGYRHVESERARLAQVAATDDVEQRKLLDALREVSSTRRGR